MKKKLLGILVCMLLISMVFSVTANTRIETSSRSLDSNGNMLDSLGINKCSIAETCSQTTTDISGLYYLRDDNPGEPSHHEGSLLWEPALEIEQTWCDRWIKFPFGEDGVYLGTNRIFNIYYHVWLKKHGIPGVDEVFNIGYSTDRTHHISESIIINTSNYISEVDEHRLIQTMQATDPDIACFEGDEIYNFTIVCQGGWPRVRTSPNQCSFIILNLEDN